MTRMEEIDTRCVRPLFWVVVCLLTARESRAQSSRERVVESIVPWLDSSESCWSAVELKNLGNREVSAEVEAHKSSGAPAALVGHSEIEVRLRAGEHAGNRAARESTPEACPARLRLLDSDVWLCRTDRSHALVWSALSKRRKRSWTVL